MLFIVSICSLSLNRFDKEQGFTSLQLSVVQSRSLRESLQEFVRGDMLEGDNRYLCGDCQEKVCTPKLYMYMYMLIR